MYIKKEIDLDQKHLEELSNKVSGSYDMAMLEANKIKNFSEAQNISENSAMDKLVQMGMIVQEEDTDVFRWVSAVMNRQVTLSFHLAKILLDNGTQTVNMLGTLYNTIKTVLLIQCCEGSDISNITGLDNGQIYFNKPYINVYQTYELVDSMKRLSRIINNIKNGTIDNKFAIDLALTQML
jgi:DNA polymerase III delta subunit